MIKPGADVTVIIPHLGATKEQEFALEKCIDSLLETTKFPIIIVQNGNYRWNKDIYIDDLLDEEERIETIELLVQGQCKAVNAAIATVNTEWIFVSNDDMVYAPGWFEKLVTFKSKEINPEKIRHAKQNH